MRIDLLSNGKAQLNDLHALFNHPPTRPAASEPDMTDEQSRNNARTLTDLQATRLDYARRELESARAADLSQLPPSGLIFLITQLIHRFDDALAVTAEVFGHPQPDNPEPPRNHP